MIKHLWQIAAMGLLLLPLIYAQERRGHDFDRARGVVSRTLDDLRHIERHEAFARENHEQYERAMRDLSDMRHDLDENRLDRERLNRASEEVERIARVDMVGSREREQLMEDVRELRRLRDDWR